MRIVFAGTSTFAVPSLRACVSSHEVVAVVTQPDRPGNRGAPAPRPVGDAAHELAIPMRTPARIRSQDAIGDVLAFAPDAIVVAAYGQILPDTLLSSPRHGAINVHASLLPRWRGAAPVAHAILAGDEQTGVSIMRMDAGLDTGPVYRTATCAIPGDITTPELTQQLAELGAGTLLDVLSEIDTGGASATPQPSAGVTLAPRLRRQDGELDWRETTALQVDRHVRALQPWPGTTLVLQGVRVRILAGAVVHGADAAQGAPGEVLAVAGESVTMAAREGAYRIDRVLPPGSRPMSAAAFLRGRRST